MLIIIIIRWQIIVFAQFEFLFSQSLKMAFPLQWQWSLIWAYFVTHTHSSGQDEGVEFFMHSFVIFAMEIYGSFFSVEVHSSGLKRTYIARLINERRARNERINNLHSNCFTADDQF